MSGWELAFAKALLRPVVSSVTQPLAKKAKTWVVGEDHVNALAAVCAATIAATLTEILPDDVDRGHAEFLLTKILAPDYTYDLDEVFAGGDPSALAVRLVERADAMDPDLDLETMPFAPSQAVSRFLEELPSALVTAASKHEAAINELVVQLELTHILQELRRLGVADADSGAPLPDDAMRLLRRHLQLAIATSQVAQPQHRLEHVAPSPASGMLAGQLQTHWRRDFTEEFARLLAFTRAIPELHGLSEELAVVDGPSDPYDSIIARLRPIDVRDRLEKGLSKTRARLASQDEYRSVDDMLRQLSPDLGVDTQRARAAARWLRQQALTPQYRHCALLLGSWGSGRTRIVFDLLSTLDEQGCPVLVVTPVPGRSLRDAVLDEAGEAFGYRHDSIRSLAAYLEAAANRPLIVVMDDVHEVCSRDSGALAELRTLIRDSTASGGPRWLLTADESRFSDLVDDDDAAFWERYGLPAQQDRTGRPSVVGGWLDLEALNTEVLIGLSLLMLLAEASARAELSEFRNDIDAFAAEANACRSPLAAWLLYETPIEGRGLADTHSAEFVDAYWQSFKQHVARNERSAIELEQTVTLTARLLAANRLEPVGFAALTNEALRLIGPSLSPEKVDECVLLLRSGRLVEALKRDPVIHLDPLALRPRSEVLWGYRVARALLVDLSSTGQGPQDLVDRLSFDGTVNTVLQESVARFALGMLQWDGDGSEATRTTWRLWIQDQSRRMTPALLAGATSASDTCQNAVSYWLDKTRRPVGEKRECFALLRFIVAARPAAWRGERRFALLQLLYQTIGGTGLRTYATYVIDAVLSDPDLCDRENYRSLLPCFENSEVAGISDYAARALSATGPRIFVEGLASWLAEVSAYLSSSARNPERFPDGVAPGWRGDGDPEARSYYFWQHLVRRVVRDLVEAQGVKAFHSLASVGWFTGNARTFARPVARAMQREANVALGERYRRGGDDEAEEYVDIVNRLTYGRLLELPRLDQRVIALFLIRHSRATHRDRDISVDEEFHASLSVLCKDRELHARHGEYLLPLCRANRIDVAKRRH